MNQSHDINSTGRRRLPFLGLLSWMFILLAGVPSADGQSSGSDAEAAGGAYFATPFVAMYVLVVGKAHRCRQLEATPGQNSAVKLQCQVLSVNFLTGRAKLQYGSVKYCKVRPRTLQTQKPSEQSRNVYENK